MRIEGKNFELEQLWVKDEFLYTVCSNVAVIFSGTRIWYILLIHQILVPLKIIAMFWHKQIFILDL